MDKIDAIAATLPQTQDRSSEQSRKCEPGWLLTKMQVLFSSYRLDQYPDPEAFMAQIGMVLGEYDPQVVAIVTSPLTGIQRKSKFPPSIAEVVEECDRVAAEIENERVRRELAKFRASHAEAKYVAHRVEHPPIKPGEDYDSMVAKYGRPIGFFE